jgi:hypothetical protein
VSGYPWSQTNEEELIKACASLRDNFLALEIVEFHIPCEEGVSFMCYPQPPPHVWESITPTIKELMDRRGLSVRVFLHRRWWVTTHHKTYGEVPEDITAWWDLETDKEDQNLTCEENLNWLESVDWYSYFMQHDWNKKWAIEAAQVRLLITNVREKTRAAQ